MKRIVVTQKQAEDAQMMELLLRGGAMIKVIEEDSAPRSDGAGRASGLAQSTPQVPAGKEAARRHGNEPNLA